MQAAPLARWRKQAPVYQSKELFSAMGIGAMRVLAIQDKSDQTPQEAPSKRINHGVDSDNSHSSQRPVSNSCLQIFVRAKSGKCCNSPTSSSISPHTLSRLFQVLSTGTLPKTSCWILLGEVLVHDFSFKIHRLPPGLFDRVQSGNPNLS